MKRPRIKSTSDVSMLAREVQRALDAIPDVNIIVVGPQQYTEPMRVLTGDERPPKTVEVVRVVDNDNPETAVTFGNCSWTWSDGAIKILDIPSMSTGSTKYSFTYVVRW